MTNEQWHETARELPPVGKLVATMDSSGRELDMRRLGNLWFAPAGKMYVRYTPQRWRAVNCPT